jgi:hypothetical protein
VHGGNAPAETITAFQSSVALDPDSSLTMPKLFGLQFAVFFVPITYLHNRAT